MLRNIVRLPLLEAETNAFMRVILVVRLIFVVLDADEFTVFGRRVKRERD